MIKKDLPVIICGTGGHARVLADSLIKSDTKILGFITTDQNQKDPIFGIEVLGDDSSLKNFSNEEIFLINGIGSIPGEDRRLRFANKMRNKGYSFASVVHISAIIGEGVNLEEGVQVMAGTVIQNNVSIGVDTIINTGALIDHDCKIGSGCHIAPGTVFSGGVIVKNGVHFGTGTKVIQNISIGKDSIIAAGSIIFRDVAAHEKIIQKLNDKDL